MSIFHTNLNNPSTPIGVLCWIVWEVVRQNALLWEDPGKISKDMIHIITRDAYIKLNKRIRLDTLDTSELPADVATYANAFNFEINERLNGRLLDKPLDFGNFDGEDAFAEAINRSPECVIPLID